MKVTRRDFVKTLTVGATLLALDAPLHLLTPGVESAFAAAASEYNYVCKMCSGGCKGRAKVVDGVVVELKGENAGQTGRGRLCTKGLGAIRMYKNPRRIKKPLIRTNPEKGPGVDPMWREASWDEAMALVATKMKAAITDHGGKSIVMAMRPSPGDITNRLAVALGTPNDMCHHDTCYTSHDLAWAVTAHAADLGTGAAAYDTYVENTDFTIDSAAGTITRLSGAIAPHAYLFVVYVGTDGKRYTDYVEFHTDTQPLSKPVQTLSRVIGKPKGKSGRNWTHDIARSKYLLSFGWDMPGKAKNMMAQDYLYAVNHGAKAVVFDPRLSATAGVAQNTGGEWIPVKPGSDLAVMFAMLKVIVGDGVHKDDGGSGRWNKAYCGTYASPAAGVSGFPKLIDHIKGNLFTSVPAGLGDGSAADIAAVLAWAAGKSGVSAATVRRIAEEFSTPANWPAYAPTHKRDAGGPNYKNSFETAHCVVLLNALVGSIDRLGGSIKQRQHSTKDLAWVCPAPPVHLPTNERIDHLNDFPIQWKMNKGAMQYIPSAILTEDPYHIEVAFFRKYNIFAFPDPLMMIEALKRTFTVVVEIQMSEMAQMADVVLPEVNPIEGRGFDKAEYFALWPQIMVTEGKVPKLFAHTDDATVAGSGPKGWRDILLTAFPKAFGTWINPDTGHAVQDFFRYNPGGTYDETKPTIWTVKMGADTASYGASKVYDHAVLKQLGEALGDTALQGESPTNYTTKVGGWEKIASASSFPEGLYPKPTAGLSYNVVGGTFPVPTSDPNGAKTFTPSYGTSAKPVYLFSPILEAYGYDPLPVWKERRQEKAGSSDLYMVTDRPSSHIHSTTQDADFSSEIYGENALLINPVTASAKGIVTGDLVTAEAATVANKGTGGAIQLKAFVTGRMKPDVVCIPHGFGHWSRDYADFAKKGANDGELIPIVPVTEILSENTPQPGCRMTDVVVNVHK